MASLLISLQLFFIVYIHNFAVIREQKPSSACEGLNNFIKISSASTTNCTVRANSSEYCDAMVCSSASWRLVLTLQHCERTGFLEVTNRTSEMMDTLSFGSNLTTQSLSYKLPDVSQNITLTSRVVPRGRKYYYLLHLDAPLLNISLPMMAIPVQCNESMSKSDNKGDKKENIKIKETKRMNLTSQLLSLNEVVIEVLISKIMSIVSL